MDVNQDEVINQNNVPAPVASPTADVNHVKPKKSIKWKTYGSLILFTVLFFILIIAVYSRDNKNDIRSKADSALTAEVKAGVTWDPNKPTSKNISIEQDEGYFLILTPTPSDNANLQFSMPTGSSWTPWQTLKDAKGQPMRAKGGIVTFDYAEFGKVRPGVYTSKFRVEDVNAAMTGLQAGPESNPITVNMNPVTMAKYFTNFQPGNSWTYEGKTAPNTQFCKDATGYQVRLDIENSINLTPRNYNNRTFTFLPYRMTLSCGAPVSISTDKLAEGRAMNYTTFIAQGFDAFGPSRKMKWFAKTNFYKMTDGFPFPNPNMQITPVINQTLGWDANFYSEVPDWPAYYMVDEKQDISLISYEKKNKGYSTMGYPEYPGNYFGWKTAYRITKDPYTQKRALRIRFWEYDSAQEVDAQGKPIAEISKARSVNFDEWFFNQQDGLITINNKMLRGGETTTCSSDPDCADQTVTMQSPQYAISMVKKQIFPNNAALSLSVGQQGTSATSIPAGSSYNIFVNYNGQPYDGFLEVFVNLPTESQSNEIFKSKNGLPLWVSGGKAEIETSVSQGLGDYKAKVRPYIYTEDNPAKNNLGPNRLGWSNEITINLK